MNRKSVFKWFRDFSKGRTKVHDEQRCVKQIKALVFWDQKDIILIIILVHFLPQRENTNAQGNCETLKKIKRSI